MLSCMLLSLFVCSAAHRPRGASSSNLSLFIDLHGSPDVDIMQTSLDAVNHTDTHTDTGTASSLDFGVQQKRSDDFSNQRQTMIRKYQSFLAALKEDIDSSHEQPLTPLQSLPSGLRDGKLAYVFIVQDRLPFTSLWENTSKCFRTTPGLLTCITLPKKQLQITRFLSRTKSSHTKIHPGVVWCQ